MESSDQNPLSILTDEPWYKDGLRFHCTECGKCCTWPGVVWLTEGDIIDLSFHFSLSPEAFVEKYTKKIGTRYVLLQQSEDDHICIFLKNEKECSVYKSRPKQCRTFPWWKQNLQSETAWNKAATTCEGIDHPDAPLTSAEEIKKNLL
ncbi:MAG: YkgJ family cysteine cluster protein [Chlamydiota bacterium]